MATVTGDFAKGFLDQIQNWQRDVQVVEVGQVLEVGDGIARVSGLPNVKASELLEFPD